MGKLFGTDGIRGVANETLTCHLAYRVGQAAAISLGSFEGKRPKVVIGKDTRISSDMLEAALLAGLTASGCDAVKLGVIPTPAVAYLTVREHADAGIVISASHNPFEHNGIKMFSSRGFKLSDELEANIESLILQEGELPVKTHGEIGRISDGAGLMDAYLDHLALTVDGLKPIKVVFDCANGAASATARKLFSRFPLEATYLSADPDGVNINDGCGSTHLGKLAKAVVDGGYDLGLAFDGDADRCLAVDEKGKEIDGDQIMAVCAEYLTAQGKLKSEGFVATVMSNLGLHKFCEEKSPEAFVRCGRRPECSGADAERIDGARRRAVGAHHLLRAHDDRRRSACGAAIFVDLGTKRQEGQRAGGPDHPLSAAAAKCKGWLQRGKDRDFKQRRACRDCRARGGKTCGSRPDFAARVRHRAAHSCYGRGGYTRSCGIGRKNAGTSRRKHTKNSK